MGLSFGGNGKYIGWSNLFDYSSLEALNTSEYLPRPKGRTYVIGENGINIDSFVTDIINSLSRALKIYNYVNLINYLNKNAVINENGEYVISTSNQEIIDNLNIHESTKIPYIHLEASMKNFISSHIQNTVQSLLNTVLAYQPIEMKDISSAAESSPKGLKTFKRTMLNPATKFIMLYQNMTGKNVIGIAANGEKASFMWHYYVTDVIKNNVESEIPYTKFSFKTNRIKGRSYGNPVKQEINILPNIKKEINPILFEKYGILMTGNLVVDLMISLILSAATDNAKELILDKINCGSKLAKVYLFLTTLGFNIDDVIKFMTSPIISFINNITEDNVFTEQEISIKDAIKIAKGDKLFKLDFYKRFLSNNTIDLIDAYDQNKPLQNRIIYKLLNWNLDGIEKIINDYCIWKHTKAYPELQNVIHTIREINYLRNLAIDENSKLDIIEFENVWEGAEEFSNLGRILGLNQGIKTDKAGILQMIQFIQSILSDKGELLDINKFVEDKEYAKSIKDRYNEIKKCVNIFSLIDYIPQYKSILKLLTTVLEADKVSIRARAYNEVYTKMKEEGYFLPEQYQKRMIKIIGDTIISKFLLTLNIGIPYLAKIKMYDKLRSPSTAKNDGLLLLNSLHNLATFKSYFENTLIPLLKEGKYPELKNNLVELNYSDELKNNKFIQSLIKTTNKDIPLYKCNLDMLSIDNTPANKIKFHNYTKGLQALSNFKINNLTLDNWFVLYNLVANLNLYGSDRLTTLLSDLVSKNKLLSLIKNYLEFVGELDYNGKIVFEKLDNSDLFTLELNLSDLMTNASVTVTSLNGQKDPSVKMMSNGTLKLFVKLKGKYVEFRDVLSKKPGENDNLYLERLKIHNSYFLFGGIYNQESEKQIESIKNLDSLALKNLNDLMKQGDLKILKNCI